MSVAKSLFRFLLSRPRWAWTLWRAEGEHVAALVEVIGLPMLLVGLWLTREQIELTRKEMAGNDEQFEQALTYARDQSTELRKDFREFMGALEREATLKRRPFVQFERSGRLLLTPTNEGFAVLHTKDAAIEAPTLENLGEGPAIATHVVWEMTGVRHDGSTIETYIDPQTPRQFNLRPGDKEPLHVVPELIRTDKRRAWRELMGVVTIRYALVTPGVESPYDTMNFKITTRYDTNPPSIVFSFDDWECGTCQPPTRSDSAAPANEAAPPPPPERSLIRPTPGPQPAPAPAPVPPAPARRIDRRDGQRRNDLGVSHAF